MDLIQVDLRHAYRELVTPGMVALGFAIMGLLAFLFTMSDLWDLRSALSSLECVTFGVFVGISDLLISYSGGTLALYLLRFRSMRQVLIGLAATAAILAAPCGAVIYTAFSVFHGGQLPRSAVPLIYLVNAMNLLWATGLVFYVLLLRLRCRHLLSRNESMTQTRKDPVQPSFESLNPEAQEFPGSRPLELEAPERHDKGVSAEPARDEPAQSADGSSADPKQLMARLPASLGEDIVCLHVSGHYLDVVTTSGTAVISMRLADAVAELHDRGMQVHRSHWAAYRHLVRLERRDHRMVLCLTGDREIPVSRPYLRAVRDVIGDREGAAQRSPDLQ